MSLELTYDQNVVVEVDGSDVWKHLDPVPWQAVDPVMAEQQDANRRDRRLA